jgi:hypothetical protein
MTSRPLGGVTLRSAAAGAEKWRSAFGFKTKHALIGESCRTRCGETYLGLLLYADSPATQQAKPKCKRCLRSLHARP